MVSLFPELLSFGLLAPFVLRLVVGFFFAFAGWELVGRARRHASAQSQVVSETQAEATSSTDDADPHHVEIDARAGTSPELSTLPESASSISPWIRVVAFVQFVTGGLLVIGAYTQVAALSAMFLAFSLLRLAPHPVYAPRERITYTILFFIALSLLFSGPGAFGFDYPL